MATFTYISPPTLFDCMKVLKENPQARILAGGTDLMVKIRDKVVNPSLLVDIKNVEKLKGIKVDDRGTMWIGALTTHTELGENPLVEQKYPFLACASRWVGSTQIRNRGTIGGNICNGSPAADTLPSLYILDARIHAESVAGARTIPISKFFCGPGMTCLNPGEIVTMIEIPPIKTEYRGSYRRQGRRRAVSIAMVSVAAMWRQDDASPTSMKFSIALGAVAPTVIIAHNAEKFLNESADCTEETLDMAAMLALKDASPISDIRTTCDYRNELIYVLTKRCLKDIVCGEGEDL